MIRTPPQHQTDPDKLPGQVVHPAYVPEAYYPRLEDRINAFIADANRTDKVDVIGAVTGRMVSDMPVYAQLPRSGPAIYKPAHGGYPGEVKAR